MLSTAWGGPHPATPTKWCISCSAATGSLLLQTVRPWSTAARLAEADPAPHGVLLAPLTAPASDGSGNNTPGFVVAAVLDTNSGQLQVR